MQQFTRVQTTHQHTSKRAVVRKSRHDMWPIDVTLAGVTVTMTVEAARKLGQDLLGAVGPERNALQFGPRA